MKPYAAYQISSAFMLLTILLFSCSDSERRTGLLGQTSTVILSIGHAADHASADRSILDRVLRFFTRNAIAQTAPATFSNIKVRVIGPDFGLIEKNFSPYGAISLNVPAGNLRQFEVTAYVAPGDPSAAASFRGTAVANLPAGETVSVPVVMELNETRIVIPDIGDNSTQGGIYNPRLVQINNISGFGMSGAGWMTNNWSYYFPTGTVFYFQPYDIDYDQKGNIYMANASGQSGQDYIFVFQNINTADPIPIGFGESSGIIALAIDKKQNFVYYISNTFFRLKRCNYNGTNNYPPAPDAGMPGIGAITDSRGMAVDESTGMLYITYGNNVLQYNPSTETTITTISLGGSSQAWDVIVKSNYVYVARVNQSVQAENQIIQYDKNLSAIIGTLERNPAAPSDMFLGPHRFVGIINKGFYVIDEKEEDASNNNERIVFFNDISGANWDTFYPNEIGQVDFGFYGNCGFVNILYYTSGSDGVGRVVQGMSIFNALRRRGETFRYLILSNTPPERVHVMDRLHVPHGEIPKVTDPSEVSIEKHTSSNLYRAITTFKPDILIVDRMWLTLHHFIDTLDCKKIFICSQVDNRFFSFSDGNTVISFTRDQYDRVIAIEPFKAVIEMEAINPLVIRNRDEILPRDEALKALGANGSRPVCLISLNFREGYFEKLRKKYSYIEKDGDYDVVYTTNMDGAGIFPVADCYNAVDLVISSASYNYYWECRYFGKEAVFEVVPASFCDQGRRLRECADVTFDVNGADQLAEIIMSL